MTKLPRILDAELSLWHVQDDEYGPFIAIKGGRVVQLDDKALAIRIKSDQLDALHQRLTRTFAGGVPIRARGQSVSVIVWPLSRMAEDTDNMLAMLGADRAPEPAPARTPDPTDRRNPLSRL